MASAHNEADPRMVAPPFNMIAKRIGSRLREEFAKPEAEPLPADHVDLLLRLRHKERERTRRAG